MDDMSRKINEMLSDPDSLQRIRGLADQLLSGQNDDRPPAIPEGIDTARVMQILSHLKTAGGEQEKLLYALRPHLSEARQARLDTAVRFLKLAELAPLLKDSGLF